MKTITLALILLSLNLFSQGKKTKFQIIAPSGYITTSNKYADKNIVYYLSCKGTDRCFELVQLPTGIYEYYNTKGTDGLMFVILHGKVYKLGIIGSAEYEVVQIIQNKDEWYGLNQ